MVFYCVIVDENEISKHQRCRTNEKNGEKVLFQLKIKNLKFATKKNGNDHRKSKVKRQNKQIRGKGRTVCNNLNNDDRTGKWYRLLKVRGKKQNNKFALFLKKWNTIKKLKLVKISLKFTNCINLTGEFEWLVYRLYLKTVKVSLNPITGLKETSTKLMIQLTIAILLIRGNVEINPGPNRNLNVNSSHNAQTRSNNMEIMTYNCNGMGTLVKRRRILNKVSKIVNGGGIVMLQETHLVNNDQVTATYKEKYELSNYKSNLAGVMTLFSNDFELIYKAKDEVGRKLYIVVQNKNEKYLLVNIYCPNDHKTSINFVEEVYIKVIQILNDHPDCFVILAGDFNCCMTASDYLNRNKTVVENDLTLLIKQNNEMCDLVDSYKTKNTEAGYTWNRGECYSRLDYIYYIYVSSSLMSRINSSKTNWSYDKSDHAALVTSIKIRD